MFSIWQFCASRRKNNFRRKRNGVRGPPVDARVTKCLIFGVFVLPGEKTYFRRKGGRGGRSGPPVDIYEGSVYVLAFLRFPAKKIFSPEAKWGPRAGSVGPLFLVRFSCVRFSWFRLSWVRFFWVRLFLDPLEFL